MSPLPKTVRETNRSSHHESREENRNFLNIVFFTDPNSIGVGYLWNNNSFADETLDHSS